MTLLAGYLIHSTIVFAVAAALDRWVLSDLSLRETVWKTALVVSLAAPLLGWMVPSGLDGGTRAPGAGVREERQVVLQGVPQRASGAPTRLEAQVDLGCWRSQAAGLPSPDHVRQAMADCQVGPSSGGRVGGAILFLILGLSAWMILAHLRSTACLWSTIRRGRHVGDLETPQGRVRLLALEGIVSPFAAGRNTVALPVRSLADLSEVQLRSVVAHEVGHLTRRDPRWQWVARLFERALFFQPLNRLCRRRLEEIAELASDDWARTSVGSGRPLAESIAAVSAWALPGAPAPALSRRPGLVSSRVARLLGPAPDSGPPMFNVRLALIVLIVAAAWATPSFRSTSDGPVGHVELIMRVDTPSGGGLPLP